ncbi:MAG TPA: hypothetical protein VJP45_06140 [Candidatus Limnocylindria bacterium]|nr:hypothetical protein [Candidatus Limnocylindria bacterium]
MNLRVKLPESVTRHSKPLDEAARHLAARDFAKAKQFARLARDCGPEARDFWRTAACDMLNLARRWLAQVGGR